MTTNGIGWSEAKVAGLTKDQFRQLDSLDTKKDDSISNNIWEEYRSVQEECDTKGSVEVKSGTDLRAQIARIFSMKTHTAEEYNVTAGMVVSNGGTVCFDQRTDHKNWLVQEGYKAAKYYQTNGSLDGFELDKDLIEQGYKVSISIENLYDDSSNDKATAKLQENGDYEVVVTQLSDGYQIKVFYTKGNPEDKQFSTFSYSITDKRTTGTEERKKPEMGV